MLGLHVQVRVINRDNPGVMQHSLTTLSSIALLRTDDLAHNAEISSIRPPQNDHAQVYS